MTSLYAHTEPDTPVVAYLVIQDRGGLFGAWLDEEDAHEAARTISGVVVELPVAGDYRKEQT